jgi:tetratricopeptide (TPR) repeat protein
MPKDERIAKAAELSRAGNFGEAENICRGVLGEDPMNAAAIHTLGLAVYHGGKPNDAIRLLERAIAIDPSVPEFFGNFGCVLAAIGRGSQAVEMLERAIALRPQYAEAHYNIGKQRFIEQRLHDAAEAFRAATKCKPEWLAPQLALFRSFIQLDRPLEALEAARRLTELSPDDAAIWRCVGSAFQAAARPAEAAASLEHALRLCENPKVHLELALALLQSGDFLKGWQEFERRSECIDAKSDVRHFEQPRWDGSPLEGKAILLYAEQGLGTTIQFVRYTPLLAKQRATVVLECQRSMEGLLGSFSDVAQVIGRGEQLPHFDVHAPLLSLPHLLRTTIDTIPAVTPYLSIDAELVRLWQSRLADLSALKVGIAWQGNPNYPRDRVRSVPLPHYTPLTGVDRVHLFTLQKGFGVDQFARWHTSLPQAGAARVTNLSPELDSAAVRFMDTAAVMMNLDLVITSDTSIAHLAGALGRDVWVALDYAPNWRWLYGRDDSPWYPTMRLFRQRLPGDWPGVFEDIADALRERLRVGRRSGTQADGD